VVGSFDFSESRILAEIYALVLEGQGYRVERLAKVASRELMTPALVQSFVDLVPEYQGTALAFRTLGRQVAPSGARATHQRLAEAFASDAISVLDFASAENKNEVVVTRETSARLHLETISDLQDVAPRLVFGGPPECPARPLCLAGLEAAYELHFETFRPLDAGGPLTVAALEGGEVDVGILFTTSPAILEKDLVVLEDDRGLQPSENIVPVVRKEIVDRYGQDFIDLVDSVTHLLSTEELRELNKRVEIVGDGVEKVARAWIASQGLS
jgi:osmoprotectant transport system substrate-binding protein